MENEIEVKIMLLPEKVPALVRWLNQQPCLAQRCDWLGNTYYDTADHYFAQQQMGLRVRNLNQQYELTLKTKGEIVNGLHRRPEYNLSLNTPEPDFQALVSQFNLPFPAFEASQLIATFSTDFERNQWLIAQDESQIEVALDQGLIKNPYGEEAICEIELELKSGKLADLFAFLAQMPFTDGMWLSNLSKAQRGYLVGQPVKFEQEIAKILQREQGEKLEQALADYVRFGRENDEVLVAFSHLTQQAFESWAQAKSFSQSLVYLQTQLSTLKAHQ